MFNDRELLARIIKCEAGGEGDAGMRAVATVIMNRVHAAVGEYQRVNQGSLRNVIFQPGQFDCATDMLGGRVNNQNIWNSPPEQIHYDIADWALSGNKLYGVEQALWYFNPFSEVCPNVFPNESGAFITRINEHCFYNPTELYAST